jgi:site-specific DNA-methyltransferase (adenine-specific)
MEDLNGREPTHKRGQRGKFTNNQLGKYRMLSDGESPEYDKKFPRSILKFPKPHNTGNHPTEKSVDLCRWLIRAYTNPGDVVMDSTMGSGTTGVAAVLEGRGFIGIEKESKYYDIARERITRAMETPMQGDLFGGDEDA